jgi:TonB family protein
MSAWLAILLGAALKSTFVLAAAWLLAFALRRQSAAARHLVWTASAVALLALPLLSVSLPALRVRAGALAPLVSTVTFRATAVATAAASAPSHPLAAREPQPARRTPWRPDPRLAMALLWAAGAALALAHMLAAWVVMWRVRRTARPFSGADLFPTLAHALGIRHRVALLEVPRGGMPLSFGVLRPAIFLPADAREWSEDRRRVVMLHELAHIRRGDLASQVLVRTAVSLFWWNPLAWIAWREFVKERERAADDLVLTAGEPPAEYAGHLLEIARSMQRVPALVSAAVAMARPSQLEGRLVAILDGRTNRSSLGPLSALTAAILTLALVAPFAALRAQDKPDPVTAQAVDATIRTAMDQQNHDILDSAAAALVTSRKYDAAQKLLENSLTIRAQTSGDHSSAYAVGLMKLGDLSARRGKVPDAVDFYSRAAALGDTPETAPGLIYLGAHSLAAKDTLAAESFIDRALAVVPSGPLAGRALTVKGNIAAANGLAGVAELQYLQALAQVEPDSPDAAFTMETYARFLTEQSRTEEAGAMLAQALPIRQAGVSAISARAAHDTAAGTTDPVSPGVAFRTGVGSPSPQTTGAIGGGVFNSRSPQTTGASGGGALRVGNGVSAPVLLHKQEPEYSEEARLGKYQGTVLLYVQISPDGQATNLKLIKSVGFGLDEKAADAVTQWHFAPGKRDGRPVTVEATIEVNFRLL